MAGRYYLLLQLPHESPSLASVKKPAHLFDFACLIPCCTYADETAPLISFFLLLSEFLRCQSFGGKTANRDDGVLQLATWKDFHAQLHWCRNDALVSTTGLWRVVPLALKGGWGVVLTRFQRCSCVHSCPTLRVQVPKHGGITSQIMDFET